MSPRVELGEGVAIELVVFDGLIDGWRFLVEGEEVDCSPAFAELVEQQTVLANSTGKDLLGLWAAVERFERAHRDLAEEVRAGL